METLKNYSTEELEHELAERKEVEKINRKKYQQARANRYLNNIGILIEMVSHGRTSCSDENPINGFYDGTHLPRCNRCFLIDCQRSRYFPSEVNIDISFQIEKED